MDSGGPIRYQVVPFGLCQARTGALLEGSDPKNGTLPEADGAAVDQGLSPTAMDRTSRVYWRSHRSPHLVLPRTLNAERGP